MHACRVFEIWSREPAAHGPLLPARPDARARIVDKVGTRSYWEDWAADVADIANERWSRSTAARRRCAGGTPDTKRKKMGRPNGGSDTLAATAVTDAWRLVDK
ncbi:hypothetical protein AS9A_0777 [Hoyosella subflava DQS3-9A1]|uniref:Uncharacterized protein n=1 Tax=Hoyosella subflava (strain DSM 45089 / JCM 17490 / NBRC 109087 / DQS3-9A1) TaxID=443218 RepID=F6ELD9_HOYSD|nr:hypothetical protein AS9A_0777 [Hoyosella subflava DQS3-9A1]